MKVTVCFGSIRVIVPCGGGDLLVSDLIEKAATRYKKATGKPPDYWVNVINLKTCNDGGILDPDDQLNDVADDREQIIALFEEQGVPPITHNGGDGTSASSVGTSSPDIFQGGESGDLSNESKTFEVPLRRDNKNDVVITTNDLSTGSNLIVRRGSEPSLTNIGTSPNNHDTMPDRPNKRWSAIAAIDEDKMSTPRESEDEIEEEEGERQVEGHEPPPHDQQRTDGNGEEEKSAFSRFARDSTRKSLSNNTMQKWLDAADRQDGGRMELKEFKDRKDPVGGSGTEDNKKQQVEEDGEKKKSEVGTIIVLKNQGGPLGIHVVPDYDDVGRDMGLIIQGIEPGGRIYRDGRLHVQDRIIEINNTSLVDVDFTRAQEIFKQALQTDNIRLRVIKNEAPPLPKLPPPILPKPKPRKNPPTLSNTNGFPPASPTKSQHSDVEIHSPSGEKIESKAAATAGEKEAEKNSSSKSSSGVPKGSSVEASPPDGAPQPPASPSKVPGSPTKKTPPAIPARHPSTTLSTSSSSSSSAQPKTGLTAPTNTRKIGKKLHIQLTKGPQGLGFSITTRDNPAGGNCPIYIKNILPKGAAVSDGRLKPGDRLLEVNGIEMTGKTQVEAVSILRNTKLGSVVNLVVSRQEIVSEQFTVPRELNPSKILQPPEKAGDDGNLVGTKNKEILSFQVALNETGSAGLGVSVKGKTTTNAQGVQDLGIFIKAVISGGAASKDGRLKVNDQLVQVNKESLLSKTNADAMETLRKAMQNEGPTPGHIKIVVARRVGAGTTSPHAVPRGGESTPNNNNNEDGNASSSRTNSDVSDNNVIHFYKENNNSIDRTPNGQVMNRNPVLDRITGNGLRKDNYQRGNDESLNDSRHSTQSDDSRDSGPSSSVEQRNQYNEAMSLASPTVNSTQGDTLMIENDNYTTQVHMRNNSSSSGGTPRTPRPVSSLGFLRQAPQSPTTIPRSNDDSIMGMVPPYRDSTSDYPDGGEMSPTGDPFSREGFGRQSFSEKRKVHQGGENHNSIFNWAKSRKEGDQVNSVKPQPQEVGATLGMKKSSSLESLQTAVQEIGVEEEEGSYWRPPGGASQVSRSRGGWNDSFRAAVDHSYEDGGTVETMDAVEEESSEGGSLHGKSSRSSFSGSESEVNVKKSKKNKDKDKKGGGGLFKLFKFGRNRKAMDERAPKLSAAAMRQQHLEKQRQDEIEKYKARKAHQDEQERIQEQYRKLQEKQRLMMRVERQQQLDEQERQQQQQQHQQQHQHHQQQQQGSHSANYANYQSLSGAPGMPQSRAERIQQLRSEHQRRHRERQGHYLLDEKEEQYEKQIQEMEKQIGNERTYGDYDLPPRWQQQQQQQFDRPTSRMGYSDPHRYSHYQNHNEIQEQLDKHDRYQEQYRNYMHLQQQQPQHPQQQQPQQRMQQPPQQPHPSYYPPHHNNYAPPPHPPPQYPHNNNNQWHHDPRMTSRAPPQPPPRTPPRARSATPGQHPNYMSYHRKPPIGSISAPQIVIQEPETYSYGDYDDPRQAYRGDMNYGSLGRRNNRTNKERDAIISSSAQV